MLLDEALQRIEEEALALLEAELRWRPNAAEVDGLQRIADDPISCDSRSRIDAEDDVLLHGFKLLEKSEND